MAAPQGSIADVPLFADCSPAELELVEKRSTRRQLVAGEILFHEGEDGDAAYIVIDGRLQLTRGSGVDEHWVADSGFGALVGEIALLAGAPRTATVRAMRDTTLLRLAAADLEELAVEVPRVGMILARRAARVAVAFSRGDEAIPPVTLFLGAGDHVEAAARIVATVANGPLIAQEADLTADGRDPAAEIRRLEATGRRVFLVGAAESVALAPFVDRFVVVARGHHHDATGIPPVLTRAVHDRLDHDLPVWLVLRHGLGATAGSSRIARALGVHDVLNIRDGVARDLRRAGRILSGGARALVLGAGGARAFAQIGAARAFTEAGREFDLIVGSGFGAVVGAQLAMGWTHDEMFERNRSGWRFAARIPTVPSVSAFGGGAPARLLRRWFGEHDIGDTWIPFRPVTTDLSAFATRGVEHGSLAEWVRAAAAIPGIYPPHVQRGHLFVDGSVVDPLPVDHALVHAPREVYAVDTLPLRRQLVHEDAARPPEGLAWIVQSIPLVGAGFPSVAALLERSLGAAQSAHQAQARSHCNVLVEPPLDRFRAVDFDAIGELAELGYLETTRVLSA
jgi:predicted acylesterase/phospholipase RssA